MNGPRRPRGLGPEDRALWEEIKKTIDPLPGRRTEMAGPVEPDAPRPLAPRARAAPAAPAKPAAKKAPPLAPLDRRSRQRVARGRLEIDSRLDLHGLTLARARVRLQRFLADAQARGDALVLVITGKGTAGGGEGALRRETPHWLSLPEMRPLVVGFEEAARHHGGAGALYVRVRRVRG